MSLEIVIGPMFSGKTSYALSHIKRLKSIGKTVLVIKPEIDKRYSRENMIVSHNNETEASFVWNITYPLTIRTEIEYIVIEEAQFFKGLLMCVRNLLAEKKSILLVGLDGDTHQNMFGELLNCIPYCSKVTKLSALCSLCKDGTPAYYTKSIGNEMTDEQINVGGSEKYISVCLKHNG